VINDIPGGSLVLFKENVARRWWLMPIILATQKAEVRRIVV
jgi:hypothetical protein